MTDPAGTAANRQYFGLTYVPRHEAAIERLAHNAEAIRKALVELGVDEPMSKAVSDVDVELHAEVYAIYFGEHALLVGGNTVATEQPLRTLAEVEQKIIAITGDDLQLLETETRQIVVPDSNGELVMPYGARFPEAAGGCGLASASEHGS